MTPQPELAPLEASLEGNGGPESYSPVELEKWKKKVYGKSYYEDDTPASAAWNNNSNSRDLERLSKHDKTLRQPSFHERKQLPSVSRGNGSYNSNSNNNNNKWERMIYGEDYFEQNIAAVSREWDFEDRERKRRFCKYSFRDAQLLKIIALSSLAILAAIMAIFVMMRGNDGSSNLDAGEYYRNNVNHHHHTKNNILGSGSEISAGIAFETKTTNLIEQPRVNEPVSSEDRTIGNVQEEELDEDNNEEQSEEEDAENIDGVRRRRLFI